MRLRLTNTAIAIDCTDLIQLIASNCTRLIIGAFESELLPWRDHAGKAVQIAGTWHVGENGSHRWCDDLPDDVLHYLRQP